MGLRKIKKERVRRHILEAAREMFFSNGFDRTTIEAIADKAEIAVGTVYNYFESKSALILAITADDTSDALDVNFQISESCTGLESMEQYMNTFMKSLSIYPKELLRELMKEAWSFRNILSKGLIRQDKTLINGLIRVLTKLSDNGRLYPNVDIEHASMVIYGAVTSALMWYAADPERTSEQMLESLEKMLEVIFSGLAPEGRTV